VFVMNGNSAQPDGGLPPSGRRSSFAVMKISGIDHVVLKVADLNRSIDFYCDILGCKLEWRRDELALAHLRVGNSFVDLVAGKWALGQHDSNMDHLCLTVADFDLDRARAELLARGVAVGEAGERFGASGWGASLYLLDPDGNGLELRS
jgi:glyoxylase I family protein